MSLPARVTALLQAVAQPPGAELDPDTWYSKHHALALELSSLQVMQLVDLIEATFEVALTSDDVTRAHFASAAALVERLAQRGAT